MIFVLLPVRVGFTNKQGWRSAESARFPPMCPGFDPGPGDICGLSLLVLAVAPRAFLPPQKSTFLNSNSIGNSRVTGLSVICTVMCYPR